MRNGKILLVYGGPEVVKAALYDSKVSAGAIGWESDKPLWDSYSRDKVKNIT